MAFKLYKIGGSVQHNGATTNYPNFRWHNGGTPSVKLTSIGPVPGGPINAWLRIGLRNRAGAQYWVVQFAGSTEVGVTKVAGQLPRGDYATNVRSQAFGTGWRAWAATLALNNG